MSSKKPKSDPTRGVAVIIILAVLFVLGALLYNAHKGKAEYDSEQQAPSTR
ncbi:hypothetical protein [Chitinasiproducens palmae]|uniref:Uncharacterized protein n=1 Tax=Chitinasiproducens palmae TaxID=1770053 RepID=A0A1H2PQM2_9BURK|nr:hypothetical protein [Chitinasiproducens palmae]SDV49135.1 hypothetical protein SAMN05216551_10794 [Chitinasiproducens palmae]